MVSRAEILTFATESPEQEALTLEAILVRGRELEQDALEQQKVITKDLATLRALDETATRLASNCNGSDDSAHHFSPVTILINGITSYRGPTDQRFLEVRSLIQRTLFPESLLLPEKQQKKARTASTSIIGRFLQISDVGQNNPDFSWLLNANNRLKDVGIEITPGKGLSFTDPDKILAGFTNNASYHDAPDRAERIIRPGLIKFLQLHTN